MIVRTTSDPATFKELVFPFLQRDPVLNTVILSNTADRVHGILADPEPPVFVSVHDGDEMVGAVLSTALRGINLGSLPIDLVPVVVDPLAGASPRSIGVSGPADAACAFAELYAERTGRSCRESERSRLHKLDQFVEQTTDLANPTSNKIYAAIGYRPIQDFVDYAFA
ncbi:MULTISPECIES: GNAT family N-acetyltransferase [unclassified Kribbella]|uniref:GNAT family N-acetyltransferase n=1 Tax=unclassified Kribbella TaxID=2644121 RepID=UPI00301A3EAB